MRIRTEQIALSIFMLTMIGLAMYLKFLGWSKAWPYMVKFEHIADHWAWFYIVVAWIPLLFLQSLRPEIKKITARWKK